MRACGLAGESGAPDIISGKWGVVKLKIPTLKPMLSHVLAPASTSIFGETFAGLTKAAIDRSDLVGDVLENVELTQTFADEDLSDQFKQVAKIINTSEALKTERAAFYVQIGGFDTHSDVGEVLETNLGEINLALRSFVAEMNAMGRWNDVAIFSKSEFGRTVTQA